jgi:hypothetical protein
MSSQADVRSIDALKDFRVALALYEEDTLAALGAVEAEVRRTGQWLMQDRPLYWQEQIKRRREQVTAAKSEVFRRQLQKKPDYSPSMSEPMEILRKAEASLQEAEKRLTMVRKWQPLFQQAVLEYHGSIQRIKELAAADVPRAVNLLSRLIDALEAYLQLAPPSGPETMAATASSAASSRMTLAVWETIAARTLDEEDATIDPAAPPEPLSQDAARGSVATVGEDEPRR